MTQLGRITGPLLEANLVRNGQDLSFRNYAANDDLLYLNVSGSKVNINANGSYDLNVNTVLRTTNLIAPTDAVIAKFLISNGLVTTSTGQIHIYPEAHMARMQVADLDFIGNQIRNKSPNGSIYLDPNGSGKVEIFSGAKVNGDLQVNGNIGVTGNLSTQSQLIIGDTIYDKVTVNPDFSQDINPGTDLTYDLGTPTKRWKSVFAHSNAQISNLTQHTITISDQVFIDGPNATIRTLQSNDTLLINPSTGITDIERIRIQGDTITNLDDTVLTLSSTGIGYVKFVDNSALVIPYGTDAEQPASPEVGTTRWNTEHGWLECFDGTVWDLASGGGATVNQPDMEDLSNVWILVLG